MYKVYWTVLIWVVCILGNIVMRKINPKDSITYLPYSFSIATLFTLFAVLY